MPKTTVVFSHGVPVEEIVEAVNQLSQEDIVDFIKDVETRAEDWGVCDKLARHFTAQVTDFLTDEHEDLEWKEEWKKFLKSQLANLEV